MWQIYKIKRLLGFPGGASGKEPSCQCRTLTRHTGSVPGSRRSPGARHGNPLQYSFLGNPVDRGAWQAIVHRVATSWTRLKQFSMHTHPYSEVNSLSEFLLHFNLYHVRQIRVRHIKSLKKGKKKNFP